MIGQRTDAARALRGFDVGSLLALGTLRNIKLDFLTFFQSLEAVHGDRRKVREQIFAATIGCDETKTFGIVKPFHCASCHNASFNITREIVNGRQTIHTSIRSNAT